MIRTTTSKTISVFPLIKLDHIGKMIDIPNWLICSSNSTWGYWVLSIWRMASSAFMPKPSATPLLPTIADWVVKVQLPFNFWVGNKFPDVCEQIMFNPPVWVLLGSRASLASAHLPISGLLGTGWSIQQDVHHPPYGPTFISIWGSGPHRSNPALSPLCAPVGSSWIFQLEYLNLPQQVHSKFGHVFSWSLLEGIKLLAQGVKHHYHVAMLIQCLENVIQGSILT